MSITSLGTSFAPASIMTILSAEPATVKFRSETLRWAVMGFSTISPSTKPTLMAAMGPAKGMSEMLMAMEAAIKPAISGELSTSLARTVTTTETSLRMSLGNSGRMGRSIIREVRIAFSVGRPSRFRKEPGILPTE